MSTLHLTTGSTKPPTVPGKLRLYSMQFCPYALRVRLFLLKKNIPHDIVNVHLTRKPDWLLEMHPQGKVPVLDVGSGKIVLESLNICDYLEENYPEPPLYPHDISQREADKQLVLEMDPLIALYYGAIKDGKDVSLSNRLQDMTPYLQRLEDELQRRGIFFGGEQPGMVDFQLWPWGEKAHVIELAHREKIPGPDKYPNLYRWCAAMRTQKEVEATITSSERIFKLMSMYAKGPQAVDYDSV